MGSFGTRRASALGLVALTWAAPLRGWAESSDAPLRPQSDAASAPAVPPPSFQDRMRALNSYDAIERRKDLTRYHWPWIALGLAVLSAGAGSIVGLTSQATYRDAVAQHFQDQALYRLQEARAQATATNVLYASAGGAALVGAFGLLFRGPPPPPAAP